MIFATAKLHQRFSILVQRQNKHVKFRQRFMSRIYNGCKVTTSHINGFQHQFDDKIVMSSFVNGLCQESTMVVK